MGFWKSLLTPDSQIDTRMEHFFGRARKDKLIVHTSSLPGYRYVDMYNSVVAFVDGLDDVTTIQTAHDEDLNSLIHGQANEWSSREITTSSRASWQTGPDEEDFLPLDCFWLCPASDAEGCYVIRLRFNAGMQQSVLELACAVPDAGKAALSRIVSDSCSNSIFRNQILHLSYEAGRTDEYGDVEKAERFQVLFSTIEPVARKDIILSKEHLDVLQRNVIDIHTRRDILKANGVPARRGVLLHGPPGTGKTFACRYLSNQLPEVTRIFVTGSSLANVGAIFSLARLLQPSVLFLEDVDLIFAARDINLYSTSLGDLLDQMDGLRSHEDICVVLTTNAIDRLEAAIKDRPGRISQCIYMGAPDAALRKRYLAHHLRDYSTGKTNIDALVDMSDGATQAFLKEWVHRAVQVACERLDQPSQKATLRQADFATAMSEMRSFLEGSDGRIIGFASAAKA